MLSKRKGKKKKMGALHRTYIWEKKKEVKLVLVV
jgi:hypothetical protein